MFNFNCCGRIQSNVNVQFVVAKCVFSDTNFLWLKGGVYACLMVVSRILIPSGASSKESWAIVTGGSTLNPGLNLQVTSRAMLETGRALFKSIVQSNVVVRMK